MINFTNTKFVKSASKKMERPAEPFLPEVLTVGKSNVGKSSLINALTQKKQLAFTSSKPGHTKLLNYYNIDNKFYLVDAPGYGFAKGGVDLDAVFGEMMNDYFIDNDRLKLVLFLLDSRRELSIDDQELITFLANNEYKFKLVITKMDKINQKEKAALVKRITNLCLEDSQIIFTSSLTKLNMDKLRKEIENSLFSK